MYEGQMITSGLNNSGDVVLAPEKKSHKKWIIIGAIALVIIIVLAVIFLIPKSGVNLSSNAKSAFNRYANYLLYENDSNDEIGQYDEDLEYVFYNVADMSLDERKTYYSRAESLLNDFEKQLGADVESSFMDAFLEYKRDFMLTKMIYLEPNSDSADFINSNYENVREYGEYLAEYNELYEKYLGEMRSSGCMAAEDIYDDCETYANDDLMSQIEDNEYEMIALENDAMTNVLDGCFSLSNMIYGKTVEESEVIEESEDIDEEELDEYDYEDDGDEEEVDET